MTGINHALPPFDPRAFFSPANDAPSARAGTALAHSAGDSTAVSSSEDKFKAVAKEAAQLGATRPETNDKLKAAAKEAAKEAAQLGAKKMAARARERAMANIERGHAAFLEKTGEEVEAAVKFSPKTIDRAKLLIGQREITVPDEVLAGIEQRTQEALAPEQNAAYTSRREGGIETLMDAPYRDAALERIKALPDVPRTQDDCNELRENLRAAIDTGEINKETFRFYADALKTFAESLLQEYMALANDRDTSADRLATLIDGNPDIRYAVASHQNTRADTLATLATLATREANEDPFVLFAVARHPNTPDDTLATLKNHRDRSISQLATQNLSRRSRNE